MKPKVSIILPVYNEEKNIEGCLKSIFSQDFREIEVLIIDDNSTDKTLEIARRYPVKILRNGKRDYDAGKAIGINFASGDFLLFIDTDNRLIDKSWISKAVSVMENKKIIGVQSWKFFYSKNHNMATRYQDLIGNVDPIVFYLGNQDHLKIYEEKWNLSGESIEESKDYVLVKFKRESFPTLGSQGFLTRREYFKKTQNFQHIEFFINLSEKGYFCFLKNEVEHLGFKNCRDIIKKLSRNMNHYLRDKEMGVQKRYNLGLLKMAKVFIISSTLIAPFIYSLIGYLHKKDYAWFVHVYLSAIIPWIYLFKFLKNRL